MKSLAAEQAAAEAEGAATTTTADATDTDAEAAETAEAAVDTGSKVDRDSAPHIQFEQVRRPPLAALEPLGEARAEQREGRNSSLAVEEWSVWRRASTIRNWNCYKGSLAMAMSASTHSSRTSTNVRRPRTALKSKCWYVATEMVGGCNQSSVCGCRAGAFSSSPFCAIGRSAMRIAVRLCSCSWTRELNSRCKVFRFSLPPSVPSHRSLQYVYFCDIHTLYSWLLHDCGPRFMPRALLPDRKMGGIWWRVPRHSAGVCGAERSQRYHEHP